MYKTRQKRQIIEFLKNNTSKQFSANEIITNVCEQDGAGKSTVYRLIAKMVDDGSLIRMSGDDGKSVLYQYAGEGTSCNEHFHLKCTYCGKLIHLDCVHLNSISEHISDEHDFLLDTKKTVFYGICSDCRKS